MKPLAKLKMPDVLPTAPAVVREAITVVAGALLAAAVISMLPGVKAWIKRAWE